MRIIFVLTCSTFFTHSRSFLLPKHKEVVIHTLPLKILLWIELYLIDTWCKYKESFEHLHQKEVPSIHPQRYPDLLLHQFFCWETCLHASWETQSLSRVLGRPRVLSVGHSKNSFCLRHPEFSMNHYLIVF